MNHDWICTTHSALEKEELIAALRRVGIPADHVMVSQPHGRGHGPGAGEVGAKGGFWPLTDAALSGCFGAAFGAYVGVFSLLLPDIRPIHELGPGNIILGSAAACTVFGMVISLAMKTWFPDHEEELQAEAEESVPVTMTIHGDDGRELQLIQEVLVATGHGDSVRPPAPGPS
jgi:hypothetical protein